MPGVWPGALPKMNRIGFKSISLWSGAIMIIVVVFGAAAILFTDVFSERLYGNKRIVFVILLLAYAVYRFYRIKQLLKIRHES